MGVGEPGVGLPHDLLELPELGQERWPHVVDLFRVGAQLRVRVVLDVPKRVRQRAAPGAGDLLLLRGPLGQLDLVREEDAARHDVHQLELGLDRTHALLGDLSDRVLLDDVDPEQVVGIALEALVAVGRDLVLPVNLGHGSTDVVRVEAAVRVRVVEPDDVPVLDELRLGKGVPGGGAVDLFAVGAERLGLVLDLPVVVVILVGVEGDLLLLAAGRVHERV